MARKTSSKTEIAIRNKIETLIANGAPGQRLPKIRDIMQEFSTSQRVVERALEPLKQGGALMAKPGAGLVIAATKPAAARYDVDCLILYRSSESRLARYILIELVARLRRSGLRVETLGYASETKALEKLAHHGKVRCCLLQVNFEIVSVAFLARIMDCADTLVIDGVSVTGIDADVVGTNWREALSVAYRELQDRGHERIGFLTSSHDARQIAMARREFLLVSGWSGPDPHPWLYQVDRLPGSYKREEILNILPTPAEQAESCTALIVWGLVEGYLLDAALEERGLSLTSDFSVMLLGSVDMPSEHVARFDVVGNSNSEKLDLFEDLIRRRIAGAKETPRTHYLPIYLLENGQIKLLNATNIDVTEYKSA